MVIVINMIGSIFEIHVNVYIISNVPHYALYQNCTNGSPRLDKEAARAPDKKCSYSIACPGCV